MKYAIVIPDGAADQPLAELEGRTPLEAASTPNMDWIAGHGKCGTVRNVPRELPCGSDVAILSVLGFDPRKYYTGRAPLEAAAKGIRVDPDEWVFRCNLVTVIDGVMQDHSAGHISSDEGRQIIEEFNRSLAEANWRFYDGVSYRHLMTYRGPCRMRTTPPHDILGEPIEQYLPTGEGSETIRKIIDQSHLLLAGHEINNVRKDLGENLATHAWLWGQGKMPKLPNFQEIYGVRGAAITAVDLVRGLARLIGWDVIEVEGATGFVNTNYAGKGAAACEALDERDLVCVHVEAPDEAGHNADVNGKVHSIQQIDEHIVGPLLERLKQEDDQWRILVLPDHPTPCDVRTHTYEPVPFAIAGYRISSVLGLPFTEAESTRSDLHVPRGCELMEYLLTIR
jgi:2,3-bisphosphoglycerate-independent phosphoglycerate mutase